MRLIFTALASYGHTFPLLPLAVAARDAGHDVVFATAEDFLPQVRKAGLETAPAGISIRTAFERAFAGDPRERHEVSKDELGPMIARAFGDTMVRAFVEDLTPLFEKDRPDLVVFEAGNPGGGFAALHAGIPAVTHGFGRVSESPLGDQIRAAILGYAAELGVSVDQDRTFIDICPESVQDPGFLARTTRLPLQPVGWSEPGPLPAGIEGGSRPLVYLTLGTAMGTPGVFTAAIGGLAGLDVDVLVATGPSVESSALGDVPDNVRLEPWVPQPELLPHVDLVVHHGGSGTMLSTFGAGKPQLILPQGADQFTNADAVLAAGVGDRLLAGDLTPETVADRARHLLTDPTIHDAARTLAAEVAAMPTPADVVTQLPTLL